MVAGILMDVSSGSGHLIRLSSFLLVTCKVGTSIAARDGGRAGRSSATVSSDGSYSTIYITMEA